ncbi:MAG: prolipoprotein diacylglyceryl transferase [Deltaproteobacteria bacterium]|nr:prolipoprotein diacylglyceryl transferase [Deltaproteobacteria bacterium]
MPGITEILQKTQHWPLHTLFEGAAYFIAYRYFLYLRPKQADPISTEHRLWILVGAAIGALFFSRALAWLENPAQFSQSHWRTLLLLSNKTIVGGLLGGLLGVEIVKKFLGVKVSSGDLMTYPLILGMMIGRVGCFFAGLQDATFGCPTELPWGIDSGDGILRHPTNLYEILFLGGLWLCLRRIEKHRSLADGARFKIFMIAYLAFRFLIEFLKPFPVLGFGLSAIQVACLLGLFYYSREILRPQVLFNPKMERA